jgi:hypothetical protein
VFWNSAFPPATTPISSPSMISPSSEIINIRPPLAFPSSLQAALVIDAAATAKANERSSAARPISGLLRA